ncbi:MAG: hypothetical protein ACRBN8_21930 [Nannocystales bacterium]
MGRDRNSSPYPLLRPWVVASVFVLLLNDHVLKASVPGTVTGKLSDFAGLLFFPYLLHALWASVMPHRARLLPCVIATGLVFSAIQLDPTVGEMWAWALGGLQWLGWTGWAVIAGEATPPLRSVSHTADPTDLWALPMLGFSLRDAWAHRKRAPRP